MCWCGAGKLHVRTTRHVGVDVNGHGGRVPGNRQVQETPQVASHHVKVLVKSRLFLNFLLFPFFPRPSIPPPDPRPPDRPKFHFAFFFFFAFFCQTEIRNTMNQSCTKPNARGVRGASPEEISHVGHLPVQARECVGCVRHCSQRVGKRSAARYANHAGPPPLPGQEI